MQEFLVAFTSGIGVGSIYALVALGFSFIYRTTASFNFAQGQLVTFGSLFAYTLYVSAKLPIVLAIILTGLIVGAMGGAIERIAIWPLIRRRSDNPMLWLISTLGLAVIATGVAERIWGSNPLGVPNFVGPTVIHLGDQVNVATSFVVAFVIAVVVTVAIDLFQRFTLWGRAMRAVADNRTAVELAGVNVTMLGLVAFVVGGVLAGVAGFVIAPITFAVSSTGFTFVIYAFASFAIGGFYSHWGALLGGLIVGVAGSVGGFYIGLGYQDLIVFGLLVAVLVVRPEGIIAPRFVRRI